MNIYFRGKEYNEENVNEEFRKITTYEEMEKFDEDYFNAVKMAPYIVPNKNSWYRWVAFIEKIDDTHIRFSVLSSSLPPYSVRHKSSIKEFVKNYHVQ